MRKPKGWREKIGMQFHVALRKTTSSCFKQIKNMENMKAKAMASRRLGKRKGWRGERHGKAQECSLT